MNNKKIAITAGDFNGIGPEIITKALKKLNIHRDEILIIGAKELFPELNGEYDIVDVPFKKEWLNVGKETKEAGEFSYQCLIKATTLAKNCLISAIVTAPVSKNSMHLAGHYFSGQTEVLEKELANVNKNEKAEMLFVSDDFRVLLLTRHVSLKDVQISAETLQEKLLRIHNVLIDKFSISNPQIALCSLNPHAGENGILGSEEIEVFQPVIDKLNQQGLNITRPMPADTLFVKASKAFLNGEKQPYDVYCACYHDQGLIPIKMLAMNTTVNMTVGLSVLRSSPAHGTAFDIAGQGVADEQSMIAAIKSVLV